MSRGHHNDFDDITGSAYSVGIFDGVVVRAHRDYPILLCNRIPAAVPLYFPTV